jgi:hypothetical protein
MKNSWQRLPFVNILPKKTSSSAYIQKFSPYAGKYWKGGLFQELEDTISF